MWKTIKNEVTVGMGAGMRSHSNGTKFSTNNTSSILYANELFDIDNSMEIYIESHLFIFSDLNTIKKIHEWRIEHAYMNY